MTYILLVAIILLLLQYNSKNNDRFKYLSLKLQELEELIEKGLANAPQPKQQNEPEPIVANSSTQSEAIVTPEPQETELIEEPILSFNTTSIIDETTNDTYETNASEQYNYEEPSIEESWWDRFTIKNPDLEKFIGENLISKIGVAILVLGIGYFVKFAIDQNWINEPARVGIGILCGSIVMGFAHKLQSQYKAFSSVLVAGAITIFYFTIGIAFHNYHLFSQTVAFGIMLAITAFSVYIAILYNRVELAALSLIGGFATPFMVSTGSGNYITLFTYITILNLAMLALAYMRRWYILNIMTYIFTVLLYGAWLGTKVINHSDAPFVGVLLFATLFYILFILINVINNIKERTAFGKTEISILISNTFLFYAAGIIILNEYNPSLKGAFTIALALFNFICALILYKKFNVDKKVIYLLIGLTLSFVTLAIPIQLNGTYITLFWATEAVLLMWLGQRAKMNAYKMAALAVHLLMLISLLIDFSRSYYFDDTTVNYIILNKSFITGVFGSASLMVVAYLLKKEEDILYYRGYHFNPKTYTTVFKVLSVLALYITGLLEVLFQGSQYITSTIGTDMLSMSYHLIFSYFVMVALSKQNNSSATQISFIIGCINSFVYIIFFFNKPLYELIERLRLANDSHLAFYMHYINLICIGFTFYKMNANLKSGMITFITNSRWTTWIFTIAIVYMASMELLIHTMPFYTQTIDALGQNTLSMWDNYLYAKTQVVKIGFPILWGCIAFVFLTIGIKKQQKDFRLAALILLAVTVIKLFTYDINNVSEAGKIIAFIILGIVLLIMSFMYQKIKALILFDEKNNNEAEKQNEV